MKRLMMIAVVCGVLLPLGRVDGVPVPAAREREARFARMGLVRGLAVETLLGGTAVGGVVAHMVAAGVVLDWVADEGWAR